MVDPTATHPVTGARESTISTSGQAHPTAGWSETAQLHNNPQRPNRRDPATSTAVPHANNYALTAATAPDTI